MQEPGSAFKTFLPSIISICMEHIYPIIAEVSGMQDIIIIIIIIMILLSEMENLFAQLIVGPAATEQRQIDVALSLSNVERQTG